MAKRQMMFTFPKELIKDSIICKLGKGFDIITNIRRTDVSENKGWVVSQGVRVDPITGDIVEG